jgi:hypothetical protein
MLKLPRLPTGLLPIFRKNLLVHKAACIQVKVAKDMACVKGKAMNFNMINYLPVANDIPLNLYQVD